jgi:hypothetical protein
MTRAPWVATGFFLATIAIAGSGPADQTQKPSQTPTTPTTGTTQQTTPQTPAAKQAGPQFVMLRIVDVKPEMVSEFIALQKSETIPGLQKAGVEWRDAWRSAAVGSPFTIAFITPLKSFAELDGEGPMQKALGQEGFRAYLQKVAKLAVGTRASILRTRPDLGFKEDSTASAGSSASSGSSTNAASQMPKLGVLANVQVVPGRQPDFEAILKGEWVPGLKKANISMYSVSEVVFGGGIGEYYTFTPIANFAQLEKGHPIQQALGEAGLNKLMAKMGPTIRHAERTIIRYDEELSFRTPSKPKTESQ